MLVVKRKRGQSIQIGENIIITMTEVHRGHVKVGIQVPPGTNVIRTELLGENDNDEPEQEK